MISKIKKIINKLFYSNKELLKKKGLQFGKNCQFAKSIDFGSEPFLISIGNDFYSSDNIQFITHDGSVNVIRNLKQEYRNIDIFDNIKIGNNVFLGYGVVVLPGATIGNNVIVGANSLVKGTLKSNCVYAGTPVKLICSIDEYIEKNKNKFKYTKHLSNDEKQKMLQKLV